MSESEALLKAIEAVYDASTDPAQWGATLGSINGILGGNGGLLMMRHPDATFTAARHGLSTGALGNLNNLQQHNLWVTRARQAPLYKAYVGTQVASNDEVKRTLFYFHALKPQRLLHMCSVGFIRREDSWGAVSFLKDETKEPFGQFEIDVLDKLRPHIARSVRINGMLRSLNIYATGLEAAAHQLAFGFLLLDVHGRVVFANAEAERILLGTHVRRLGDGRLAGSSGMREQRFAHFLDRLTVSREAAALRINRWRRTGSKADRCAAAIAPTRL